MRTHQPKPRQPVPAPGAKSPAPSGKNTKVILLVLVLIGGLGLVIVVGGFLAYRYMAARRNVPVLQQRQAVEVAESPSPEPSEAPSPIPSPTQATPLAPEGMVAVAAGAYTVGRDEDDPFARPAHSVTLPAFFIDRTEVTNADYKKFTDATNHKSPDGWEGGSFLEGKDNFPVVGITWRDASEYALWANKRLPTEAEWEAAARGQEGYIYPWGNEWRSGLSNAGNSAVAEVGSFKDGASPCGALDMVGNVWEWTADEFELYPGSPAKMPELQVGVTFRVISGGAFDAKSPTTSYRGYVDESKRYPKTGFRCVKEANP
jgi:formylglycine-generating enzyme required for sulfatase activity